MAEKLEGSTKESVEAAKAEGASTGASFRAGTEPLQKFAAPEARNINPTTTVPHADEKVGKMEEAFVALLSGDLGAARRAYFGDADIGITSRDPREVANPVEYLSEIPEAAGKQLERQKEVADERADRAEEVASGEVPVSMQGAPFGGDKPEEDLETQSGTAESKTRTGRKATRSQSK